MNGHYMWANLSNKQNFNAGNDMGNNLLFSKIKIQPFFMQKQKFKDEELLST